jgi:DNA-binding transcriptional ArsR family regulator
MNEYRSAGLDAIFNGLSDPTRRAILARLQAADARVTDIAGDFPISLNSVFKHIRMLERAGLRRRSINGRDRRLPPNAEAMAEGPPPGAADRRSSVGCDADRMARPRCRGAGCARRPEAAIPAVLQAP